jgi:hypothetical protein
MIDGERGTGSECRTEQRAAEGQERGGGYHMPKVAQEELEAVLRGLLEVFRDGQHPSLGRVSAAESSRQKK